jgi:hypothetical protein
MAGKIVITSKRFMRRNPRLTVHRLHVFRHEGNHSLLRSLHHQHARLAALEESLDLAQTRAAFIHHFQADQVDPVQRSIFRIAQRFTRHRDIGATQRVGRSAVVASRELGDRALRMNLEVLERHLAPAIAQLHQPNGECAQRIGGLGEDFHLHPAAQAESADHAPHHDARRVRRGGATLRAFPARRRRLRSCHA